jgi:electron transport complex protein RnfB
MWLAVLLITLIALVAGLALSFAARRLPADSNRLVDQVNELLPQTQCAQCGYPGCRPYAAAIVDDDAAINLCPPGGDDTAKRLAALLGRDAEPLAAATATDMINAVAVIDESLCIGCTHCLDACPVDAIVGAQQMIHTVVAGVCTGCELCLAPCPVDCIRMESRG